MIILIKEQVIRMYNKIEIEHNFEQLVKNVMRDTTLSQQDITNWLINERAIQVIVFVVRIRI